MAFAPRRCALRPWLPGWLVAVLALVSQLALGAVVLPDVSPAEQLAALDAAMVECAPADGPRLPAPPHRQGDAALCPLSVALALPGIVLSPAPFLPPSAAVSTRHRPGVAQARAPPDAAVEAPYPRGPPILA